MSSRKVRLNTAETVDVGCNCRRSSRLFTAIFHRPKKHMSHVDHSSSNIPKSPFAGYYSDEDDIKGLKSVQVGFGRVGGESVAVEKDSDDPYLDFRRSMLSMIVEKEIYSKDDLIELLNCFLHLNSPLHHGVIIRAFAEIWNGVYYSSAAAWNGGSPTVDGGGNRAC